MRCYERGATSDLRDIFKDIFAVKPNLKKTKPNIVIDQLPNLKKKTKKKKNSQGYENYRKKTIKKLMQRKP